MCVSSGVSPYVSPPVYFHLIHKLGMYKPICGRNIIIKNYKTYNSERSEQVIASFR